MPTVFAEESKEPLMASTYTMHLKKNSSSSVLIRIRRVAPDAECTQNTDESTSVLDSGETIALNCSADKKNSYCIR